MVQASSFLLLLAFAAVMIQGAPLAARSKEHRNQDSLPTEESKLQMGDGAGGPPQFPGEQASGFGPVLPFVEQAPPSGTRRARIIQAGPPVTPPSCMDPQKPQPADQQGPPEVRAEGAFAPPIDRQIY
ncbi:hypothetical protein BCR42DRAFT_443322 [Absidia repens]|uniref:Uncharacterized protein n=1 Tax=Absidia repens TaxID=90262 RepID=A0A1X2I174_9FUNG|nr:hypothetical protein BCR42DRAFT_443322 [Absidia repens]